MPPTSMELTLLASLFPPKVSTGPGLLSRALNDDKHAPFWLRCGEKPLHHLSTEMRTAPCVIISVSNFLFRIVSEAVRPNVAFTGRQDSLEHLNLLNT